MFRSHTCGELRLSDNGTEVTLAGWVQTVRKFGSITFVDLRDRYGITQLLFGEELNALLDQNPLGREFVLQVKGRVSERSNKNPNLSTGEIEILVSSYKILNRSAVPPFTIQDDTDGGDDLRMKYRYLDLRRNAVKKNLELRYAVNRATRDYLHQQGFMDIETPFLIKSTPEGARDFVVPSRMNEGQFYALPQSPQTFKQLLMVSGYDRYYQIVKCFRDEDLRADRQPEFTQIDCEMAFVEQEDILNMFEGLVKYIFKQVKDIDYTEQVQRMTWEDAMWHYGIDKPDIRFGMKLANLKSAFNKGGEIMAKGELINGAGFGVFDNAETVLAIAVPGAAEYTRKQLDELTEWVKRPQIGMQGMVNIKYNADGSIKSSVDKFYNEEKLKAIADFAGAQPGDLVLVLAGAEERTRKAISELRLELGERMGLRKKDEFKLLWVLDFPLFEYAEDDNRWVARHHPFTSPKPEQIDTMINNDPRIRNAAEYLQHPYANIKANAYDMVLNGNEIGGGSIRIFQRDLQEKMFAALGMSKEEAMHKFGFLLGAFEYGAPPHGGIAFGFDRLCAILGGSESIRDFIAFPKNNSGRDVMLDAPSTIDEKQLIELNIILNSKEGCHHRFEKLLVPSDNIEHLFIGTFNPIWNNPKGNNADYFYGRHTNYFWKIMPVIFGGKSLFEERKNVKNLMDFQYEKKIGISDMISCVANANYADPIHRSVINSFEDKYLDLFEIEFNYKLLDFIKNNSTLKGIYLTRQFNTHDKKTKIFKFWNEIKHEAQKKGIRTSELVSPSRRVPPTDIEEKIAKWSECINPH